MPETSAFENELAIEKLKNRISQAVDQIPGEMIKAGDRTFRYEIHKLINSIWNKEELPGDLKESIIVTIYKKCDKQFCSNYRDISLLSNTFKKNIQNFALKVNPICRRNYWGSSM